MGRSGQGADGGRDGIGTALGFPTYRRNLQRLGFSEDDLVPGGSDRLIDALVARGTLDDLARRVRDHLDAEAAGQLERAAQLARRTEALARSIAVMGVRAKILTRVAESMAAVGLHERAEEVALSVTGLDAQELFRLTKALHATGDRQSPGTYWQWFGQVAIGRGRC
jgi:hypothetical protein